MSEGLGNELADLLNKHSAENYSDTPDFILARYMLKCLVAFDEATNERAKWFSSGMPMSITGDVSQGLADAKD